MAGQRPCDSSRRTGAEASRRPWGETLPAFTVRGGLCGTQVRFAGLLDTSTADGHPQATRTEEHQNNKRPTPTQVGCAQQGIGDDFTNDEQRARCRRSGPSPRARGWTTTWIHHDVSTALFELPMTRSALGGRCSGGRVAIRIVSREAPDTAGAQGTLRRTFRSMLWPIPDTTCPVSATTWNTQRAFPYSRSGPEPEAFVPPKGFQ